MLVDGLWTGLASHVNPGEKFNKARRRRDLQHYRSKRLGEHQINGTSFENQITFPTTKVKKYHTEKIILKIWTPE